MRYILFLVVCVASLTATAQNKQEEERDLNREMTLEREYDPIVQDAAKVNTLPVVREMTVTRRPIVYSDYAVPLSPDKEMTVLPPNQLRTDFDYSMRNGYLHFGGGMFMNLTGDIGYHILNTDRDKLGLWFSHRSTNWNVKPFEYESFSDTLARKAKINDNLGGLDYKHTSDASIFKLGGKFGYSTFNYYGTPTNYIASSALESFPAPIDADFETNQVNQLINAYASLASTRETSLGYHAGVDFTNFNQKYALGNNIDGIKENHFKMDFGLSSPVNDGKSFGANILANVLTYTAPDTEISLDSTAYNTHFNATFNPYFSIDKYTWKLIVGLNLMLVSQNAETNVYVSPNISLDVPFSATSVFYTSLTGRIESNSMAELSRMNRYFNTLFPADASKTWADLTLGIRSSAAPGLWLDIFGGYKYTEAELFFNPSSYYLYSTTKFGNFIMPYQPVSQRIQVGASLKYDYRQVVNFYLKGVYNHYSLKDRDEDWKFRYSGMALSEEDRTTPYGKPAFTVNAGISVRPVKPLTINLDYAMLSGMYAHISNDDYAMKPVNDLRLQASWQFTDAFSLYARLNNLLFQKHELYYGYHLQPFSAMAGLNLNF
ncbi:MAG: TonB-dependent receptor [Tannerella sp.]|jgi:hypothetical protein|nr:TonB-dependent receptor [Tannerella sp.]